MRQERDHGPGHRQNRNIYAAGVGEKHGGTSVPSFPPRSFPFRLLPLLRRRIAGRYRDHDRSRYSIPPCHRFSSIPGAGAAGGSEIYRIAPDGSPSRLWSSHEDIVYALAFDQHGRLLAGTGNRGHIFAISGEDEFTDLLKASATQVTAFANAPEGGLYASTSNLGKVFLLSATPESEGTYESDVFDAHIFSRWGRAEFRGTGNVELFARSGNVDNPDRNWSPWEKIDLAEGWCGQRSSGALHPVESRVALRAILRRASTASSSTTCPKTWPPILTTSRCRSDVATNPCPSLPAVDMSAGGAQQPHFDAPPPTMRDRDSIGVKWSVHDDNDDQMIYCVYYAATAKPDGSAQGQSD